MSAIYRLLSVPLTVLLITVSALAQTTSLFIPSLPSDVATSLARAEFAGKGKLTFFGLEVYESSLWVAPNFKSVTFGNHGFALELHYLRNFTAADIAKRSLEEMQRIEAVPEQKSASWIKALTEVIPNVKKGDRLIGVHNPGTGVSFWLNGKSIGEIKDAEFSRQFFAIWLSPKTSEPKLRTALLGVVN